LERLHYGLRLWKQQQQQQQQHKLKFLLGRPPECPVKLNCIFENPAEVKQIFQPSH
jgi:hypothetical protein